MLTKLKMMRDSAKCLLVVIAVMLLAALGAVVMAGEPEPGLVGVAPSTLTRAKNRAGMQPGKPGRRKKQETPNDIGCAAPKASERTAS